MPSARDSIVSELLQARSLLLAGQAGLCCNPRCATSYVLPYICSHYRCKEGCCSSALPKLTPFPVASYTLAGMPGQC